MIDHLNQTRRLNIISLEDPIEFVHRSKNSQVIQRELNTHIPTFARRRARGDARRSRRPSWSVSCATPKPFRWR